MFFRRYWFLVVPVTVFLLVTFLRPLVSILATTVYAPDKGLFLDRYVRFFSNGFYRSVFWRTVRLGLVVTAVCVLMGYPISFYLSRLKGRRKSILLALVVFPLLTNSVVRTYSWMVVLGRNGFINSLLQRLSIINEPIPILYTPFAVAVGLVHLFLPLMILSLTSAMENIDTSLIEAAQSLGASDMRAFARVVVPLTLPGLVVGSVLVFTGSTTAYVTPHMLGGSRVMTLATLLYQKAMVMFDWTTATTIAAISVFITLVVIWVFNAISRRAGVRT